MQRIKELLWDDRIERGPVIYDTMHADLVGDYKCCKTKSTAIAT